MGGLRKSWWYYFKQSIDIYKKGGDRFIGREANGNRYYERQLGDKLKRYVLNQKDLDIPSHPLWRSWLSHKRKDPPTEAEIQANLDQVRRLKQKSEEVFDRDIEKFPDYADKLKKSGEKRDEEAKLKFPKHQEYL